MTDEMTSLNPVQQKFILHWGEMGMRWGINRTLAQIHAEKDQKTDAYTTQKLRELANFFETMSAWYGQVRHWSTSAVTKFIMAGDKIRKLLGTGG